MNTKCLLKFSSLYAKFLLAFFLTVLSSQAIYAYDLEIDGIYYSVNADGTSVTVTSKYNSSPYNDSYTYSGDVVIPSSIQVGSTKTLNVTAIGDYAFYNCSYLTSVSIPEGITIIGNYAFYGCRSLTSIPEGITIIGDCAFSGCSSLTSIPEGVTSIGNSAFSNCSFTSISIPGSVTNIGNGAFYYCTSLTYVSIPEGMTSIASSAFKDCSSLTYVSIPESVTSIGYYTFENCSSLTYISIPKSVTDIGAYAFYNCFSLISVVCLAEQVPVTPQDTPSPPFAEIPRTSVLYVPASAIEDYKADYIGSRFGSILPIEEGIELSISEAGLATYCPTIVNVDLSEAKDIAAYRATVEDNTVILTRAYKINIGEGVLLRSLNGGAATENVKIGVGKAENEPNDFVGVLEDSKWLQEKDNEGNTNFVLSRQEDGTIGFYKADFIQITKGKAYLPVANYSPSTAEVKGLRLVFDDGTTTGIDIADAQQTEAGGAYYTLSGMKVDNPTAKGIYIKNGKKYIVK